MCFFLEAPPGIEPGIEVLQTFALPLGHSAVYYIRTRHNCLSPEVALRSNNGRSSFSIKILHLYTHAPMLFFADGENIFIKISFMKIGHDFSCPFGADYGDRTRHLDLGKVALYQMS